MKGKIIFVHKLFPIDIDGVLGGAETVSVETAFGFAKAGWDVYFFGYLPGGNRIINGVKFVNYGENYDLYNVFKEYKNIEFDACLCVHAYPVKTLIGFENIHRFFLLPQDMSFIEHRVTSHFVNKYMDGVICISEYQKEAYLRWGVSKEKLIKIPYGIDTERYKPSSTKNFRKIMFAGATIKQKGIDLLLDAFKILKKRMPEIELHIYGDATLWGGTESVNVDSHLPGVFFHGKVEKEDLIKAYGESALCVIPTVPELYQESLPRSSLEAQACGCPVIGTKSGGLPETFLNGETGFLVDPLNVENLAQTIEKALKDENTLRSMSNKAVEFIKENFSHEKHIKRLEEYILSVPPLKERVSNINYVDLKILYYTEVPLMPSKTSSCNRNYEIIRILLEKGAKITYTHGFFVKEVEMEIRDLADLHKNFNISVPVYKKLSIIGEHDLLWITEAWDLERLRKALALARIAKLVYDVPVVFDAMDCIYKHLLSGKKGGANFSQEEIQAVRTVEKELYDISDIVIFVSEEEREFAVREFNLDIEKTFIISNVHHPVDTPTKAEGKSVCFIGGILNFNNLLAVKYFLNAVYPHVLKRDNHIEFYVIGDRTDELKIEDLIEDKKLLEIYKRRVHLIGWVKDIGKEIRKHKLSVAPMVSGSGIKGKILNSLEWGVPVVTTPIGAEGFANIESSGIVVAKEPEEFADAVVNIIEDTSLREDLAKKGLNYVRENFSKERAGKTLDEMLPMIRRSIALNFSEIRPCGYNIVKKYYSFLPAGYEGVDNLDQVVWSVISKIGGDFDVISFNFMDVYRIEPRIRPFLLEDPPESYRWLPALIVKDMQKKFLKKGSIQYLHIDIPLCYREYTQRGLKGKLIELGLKNKMFFKRHPILEKVAKRIYRLLT
ncbi:glycosyltransferase [Hydrogenobacter thermophilus]|uniref:glycosyltransferase n=1 Tax=Hydrogenobacter thermophilus TaxID=940 RepID=UPI0030F9F8EC